MPIARALPTLTADSSAAATPNRSGPYGEAYVLPVGSGYLNAADEGSYFCCTNAAVATGIAGHAAPVVADADTKALFHLYNAGSKNIYFDYLTMEVTAAGTAGTIHYSVVYIDNKGSTARSSGGTAISAISNCNSGSSNASGAAVYFGAVVTAMTSSKCVGLQIVREVIPVVQDTVCLKFGSPNAGARSMISAGTATAHLIQHFPPIVIKPGGNLNISQIRPSQSAAASYQFQAGWIER